MDRTFCFLGVLRQRGWGTRMPGQMGDQAKTHKAHGPWPRGMADTDSLLLFSLNNSDHWAGSPPGLEIRVWREPQVCVLGETEPRMSRRTRQLEGQTPPLSIGPYLAEPAL